MAVASEVEKRRYPRRRTLIAMSIDARDRRNRFGVCRDASAGGTLFNTPSRFQPDEELTLRVYLDERAATTVQARVVRTWATDPMSNEVWRYMTAVEFTEPRPDLEPLLFRTR